VPESPTRVLSKARNVMDCFLPDNRPLTLTQVAQATELPLSTARRLLQSLVAEEFLAHDSGGYRLGLGVIGWASAARRGLSVVDAARLPMESLRDLTGETVTLLVREGLQRVCVASASSRQVISQRSEPGDLAPLQSGSPSKVLLAWDATTTQAVLDRGLRPLASGTVMDTEVFLNDLAAVRERGWAISFNENAEGVASISAPIWDATGNVAAALCLGGPTNRLTEQWFSDYLPELTSLAGRLSRILGAPTWAGEPDRVTHIPSATVPEGEPV
jgi:IclR family transcriptional regulator, acetate operon repressor